MIPPQAQADSGAPLTGLFGLVWESWQPRVEHRGVRLVSVEEYYDQAGDLGWSRSGARVRMEGVEGSVDFPARRWDRSLSAGDSVVLLLRRGFPGEGYDGLSIARHTGRDAAAGSGL